MSSLHFCILILFKKNSMEQQQRQQQVGVEEERSKCLARLQSQTTDKCRHRTFYELASCEARLGHPEDALSALRDAIACGLDAMYYMDELKSPLGPFASLQEIPAFQSLLLGLSSELSSSFPFVYAKGEKERCVADALLCSLCNEPLVDPHSHECGLMFCKLCASAQCPQCLKGSSSSEAHIFSKVIVRVIRNKLDTLRCHCPRCQRTFERAVLAQHVETCPVQCPSGCGKKVTPSELATHAQCCTSAEISCSAQDVGCHWRGARKDLNAHVRCCPLAKQHAVLRRVSALEEVDLAVLGRLDVLEEEVLRRLCALEEENRVLRAMLARMESLSLPNRGQ